MFFFQYITIPLGPCQADAKPQSFLLRDGCVLAFYATLFINLNMSSAAIRHKLYDYIRVADDKKLHAIYNLLENEIEQTAEWWKNKDFIKELDSRAKALDNGPDKGYTISQLEESVAKLHKKVWQIILLLLSLFLQEHKKKLYNPGIGMRTGNGDLAIAL